ncbi:MAG: gliding motility-associated C-terminal domain-containing protein [Bacteroidetes bacterium]|nr:gliding motility-associated C-terminal domain-containing protein [Bacteroidota bacterium]MBU1720370.1 gliding motility-associated C-terminal domain-containing protein [Bacteroidota bacterium]
MKRITKIFGLITVFSLLTFEVGAQCEVSGYTSTDSVMCGSCATLSAYGQGQGLTIFSENFNSGSPTGWAFTQQAMWNNPCSPNGVDGTTHLWMGNSSGVPRILETQQYDLTPATAGVTICFDMLFAEQGDAAPCEGPDEPDEGLYLQYSIDNGVTWIDIHYFDPNGGYDSDLINWRNWCFDVPPGAITDHTTFRWFQDNDSGADYDHWGIDNVVIYFNDPTYEIIWQHDGCNLGASGGVDPTPVCPQTTTTYTVVMSNGTSNCSSQVTIAIKMPNVAPHVDSDTSICSGDCVTLTGDPKVIVSPAKTPTYENNQLSVVTSGSSSVNINITDLNQTTVQSGAITSVCINGFTFSGTQLCTSFGGCNCNGTMIALGATCTLDISSFDVFLRSPDGCEVKLVPQFEASGTSYTDVCFVPVGGTSISDPSFASPGDWDPFEPLSGMDGCLANGVWTIEFDAPGGVGFGVGSFTGWSISFDDPEISYQGDWYWQPTTNMTNSNTLTPTVCPTVPTSYGLVVTDTAGCVTATASAYVDIHTCCNISYSATVVQPTCGSNNGSINLIMPPGTFTFSWSNGATTEDISGVGAGAYTVTINDPAAGCTKDTTITLTSPGSPSITGITSTSTCPGQSQGSATVTATGGNPAYSYAWSSGGSTTATASNLPSGTFTVTVSDLSGCSVTGTVTVGQHTLPTTTFTYTPSTCTAADGSATANPSGTGPFSYYWQGGQTGATATGLAAGSVSVTITDGNGCTKVESANVPNSGGFTVTVSTTPSTCTANNGTATANPVGGTSPFDYLWSGSQTSQTITGLGQGDVYVTVTDDNGCVAVANGTVDVDGAIVTTASGTNVVCYGESTGSATVTVTGGATPMNYSWSNSQTTQNISNVAAGTYYVTVTDNNGCVDSSSVVIGQPADLIIDNVSTSNPSCPGVNNGTITVTAHGGSGSLTYNIGGGSQASGSFTGLSGNTYTITVTDANGCTETQSATLVPGSPPTITANPSSATVCAGNCVTVTVSGASTYTWAPTSGIPSSTSPTNNICPSTSITYTVQGADGSGCTGSVTIPITVAPLPVISVNPANPLVCDGASATLTAMGATSYTWAPTNILSATSGNPVTVSPQFSQSVTVIGTTGIGCNDTLIVPITVAPPLNPGFVAGPVVGCAPHTVHFTNSTTSPGLTYNWNFGDPGSGSLNTSPSQSPNHTYQSAGTYDISLTVTDPASGCTETHTTNDYIVVFPVPEADFISSPMVGVPGTDFTFTSTSTDAQTWSWNFGDQGTGSSNYANTSITSHTYNQVGEFIISLVVSSGGSGLCPDSITHSIRIIVMDVPNVVTPNGDGINDKFHMPGMELIENTQVVIYNRWGGKVFESTNFTEGWDASEVSDGVYFYIITFPNGESQAGTITVIGKE